MVQPGGLLEPRARQPLQRRATAYTNLRQRARQVQHQGRVDVGAARPAKDLDQPPQRMLQPLGIGNEVLLQRHPCSLAGPGTERTRRRPFADRMNDASSTGKRGFAAPAVGSGPLRAAPPLRWMA